MYIVWYNIYIYLYIYMSVRQYSLYNPVPWTNGGGPIAFAGFGAAENKGISFGGFCLNIVTIQSWTEGASLRGGVLSLLGVFARFLYLTAFLLLVPDTRVSTIAHICIGVCTYMHICICFIYLGGYVLGTYLHKLLVGLRLW